MDQTKPFIVSYRNDLYDLSRFAHKHPGGVNTLYGLNNQDMAKRFEKAPGHSPAAVYLMKEYKISSNNNENVENREQNSDRADVPSSSTDIIETTDDSMEYLVDWTQAMIPQIPKLGNNYAEWVLKPVDRPLRLFGPIWLENLTKTPWWVVPAFWVPSIIFLIYLGFKELVRNNSNSHILSSHLYLNLIAGIVLWTFLEYSLHRWVFHLDPSNQNKYVITFHFLMHGLHHKVPFDPYRLVFPPTPAVILAYTFYQPLPYIFNYPKLILAGGLIGYLCYDMIHYYIHYGSPTGGHLYHMKRYHYQHHFVHHDKGFGISSTVWDKVFGTRILLRKLKKMLKW